MTTTEPATHRAADPVEESAAHSPLSEEVSSRLRSLQLTDEERAYAAGGGTWWLIRWIAALMAIFGGVYWFFGDGQRQTAALLASLTERKVAVVEAFRIKKEAPRQVVLDVTGSLKPRSEVGITSMAQGYVIDVSVRVGDRVRAGDRLALIDPSSYLADVKQAEAALATAESRLLELQNGATDDEIRQAENKVEQAQSNLELATAQRRRADETREGISRQQYEAAVFAEEMARLNLQAAELELQKVKRVARKERLDAARADVAQAEAALAQAQWLLEQTELKAPVDGVVIERNVDLGEIYSPGPLSDRGGMIVLADLSEVYAEIDVQERDLHLIDPGQPCEIIPDAYPDVRYEGVVDRLGAEIDRARGVLDVRIRLTNPDERLFSDMNCRVVVYSSAADDAEKVIRVPADTVLEEDDRYFVWVENEGRAVQRDVQLAEPSLPARGRVEITSGLSEGDILLAPATAELSEGIVVRPTFDGPR